MTAEAHFLRTDAAEGTRFEITPASSPRARGCVFAFGFALVAIIALWGLSAGGIAGLVMSGVVWGPLLLFLWLVAKSGAEKYSRAPVTLIVNSSGITAGTRLFPAESIAELLLRHPDDDGGHHDAPLAATGARALGQSVANSVRACSYALMARLKANSVPEVLVFGLTYNTGCALLTDVRAAMRRMTP